MLWLLNKVTLKIDKSVPRDNGYVIIRRAALNDNDTGGTLPMQLLTQTITLDVTDSNQFHATIALTGCKTFGRLGSLRCYDKLTHTRATFRVRPSPKLYRVAISRRQIGDGETGFVLPAGPVTVVLHQGPPDRSDDIPVAVSGPPWIGCRQKGLTRLVCNDP